MSTVPCHEFRRRLEQALRGHPERFDTRPFAWHEHLLSCADCRALLEAEEALEDLLASLPAPRLPAHLATRVLERLIAFRTEGEGRDLDHLLDLDRAPQLPPGLAPRILAGLSAARRSERSEERLDALLDLVPAPRVPAGLDGRVLAALERARRPRAPWRLVAGRGGRRMAAAAAAFLLGFFAWRLFFEKAQETGNGPGPEAPVDAELIAALDVLQRWDLLMSDDTDLQLASIGAVEETLFEAVESEGLGNLGGSPEDEEGG